MIQITAICNRQKSPIDFTWIENEAELLLSQAMQKSCKSRNVTQNKHETCALYSDETKTGYVRVAGHWQSNGPLKSHDSFMVVLSAPCVMTLGSILCPVKQLPQL